MSDESKPVRYKPGGFVYENLKLYLETGERKKSDSDRPNAEYYITDEFVQDIKALDSPSRRVFVELGKKHGLDSYYVPEQYYKAYAIMTGKQVSNQPDKKKITIPEEEYNRLLDAESKVTKYEYGFNQAKIEYDNVRLELAESRTKYGELAKENERLSEELKSLRRVIATGKSK